MMAEQTHPNGNRLNNQDGEPQEHPLKADFSRRGFLKTAALVGGAAAVSGGFSWAM